MYDTPMTHIAAVTAVAIARGLLLSSAAEKIRIDC